MTMIDTENPVLVFDANDRCDGCGAQAYVLARKEGLAELLFCLHHIKACHDALLDEGWEIVSDAAAIEDVYPDHPVLVV